MKVFGLFLTFGLCVACTPSGPHRPVNAPRGNGGFASVKGIFTQHCASCHPSRSAPDWLNYDQAKVFATNGRLVQRVVVERSMPPPQSAEAARMTEADRQAIEQWVTSGAGQGGQSSPPPDNTPEAAAGVQNCFQCHGAGGVGTPAGVPRLAGQSEEYLFRQLEKFRWRERLDPSYRMNEVAAQMSEDAMRASARWFADQPWSQLRPGGALRLAENFCNVCHVSDVTGGNPLTPLTPELRGQNRIYLVNQLLLFRADEKRSPLMHQFARELSNADIDSLAAHYSADGPSAD